MPYEFAGAYDAAVLDSNSLLLKNTAFELVTEPGGVLTPLYTNRTRSGPVAQPFLSDAEGNVHIFADPGRYRLRQAGSPPGEEITVQPDPDETEGELEAHVVAADPHPGYLSDTDHDARDHSVPAASVVLDDLQNVTVPAPVLNDVLTFDGTDWVNAVSAGGMSPGAHDTRDHSIVAPSILLQEIGDVSDTPPLNAQVPQYNAGLGMYVPSAIPGGGVGPAVPGQVAFFTSPIAVGGDTGLVWDSVNDFLGVGLPPVAPARTLDVSGNFRATNTGTVGVVPVQIKGAPGQTGALTQWKDSTDADVATIGPNGNLALLGSPTGGVATAYFIGRNPTVNVVIVQAAPGQVGNLQTWIKASGDSGIFFDSNGNIVPGITGVKIGTTTTDLLSFWNATPVTQRAFIPAPVGGGTVDTEARTAINLIRQVLIDTGLKAAA